MALLWVNILTTNQLHTDIPTHLHTFALGSGTMNLSAFSYCFFDFYIIFIGGKIKYILTTTKSYTFCVSYIDCNAVRQKKKQFIILLSFANRVGNFNESQSKLI